MTEQPATVHDGSEFERSAPMSIDLSDFGSMSLSYISAAIASLDPPYPDELLDALKNDPRSGAKGLVRKLLARQAAEERTRGRIEGMLEHERRARADGFEAIAGVDEVGRGPLAGPVVAAAVILPPDLRLAEVNDSKLLTEARRRTALTLIAGTSDFGIGVVSTEEIDRVNIYRASQLAMRLAIEDLPRKPDIALVDGRPVRGLPVAQRAIVRGDKLSLSIAAASIVAKVVRDRMMVEFDRRYPKYMFARHKGYGTAEHLTAIKENGVCPLHRRSFAPVRDSLRGELA